MVVVVIVVIVVVVVIMVVVVVVKMVMAVVVLVVAVVALVVVIVVVAIAVVVVIDVSVVPLSGHLFVVGNHPKRVVLQPPNRIDGGDVVPVLTRQIPPGPPSPRDRGSVRPRERIRHIQGRHRLFS